MLVKVVLDIPPVKGQTVIPRLALVVINGNEYVFVKKAAPGSPDTERFERRKVSVAQENSDFVVVANGLEDGETDRHQRQPDPRPALRRPPDGRYGDAGPVTVRAIVLVARVEPGRPPPGAGPRIVPPCRRPPFVPFDQTSPPGYDPH